MLTTKSPLHSRAALLAAVTAVTGVTLTALTGCTSEPPPGADVTADRAGYVELMLDNARSSGPQTLSTVVAVITKYGGGVVTSVTASGTVGSSDERLRVDAALGPGPVEATVQGERTTGAAPLRCFEFTATYLTPAAGDRPIACPAGLTAADTTRLAVRTQAAEAAAAGYTGTLPSATLPRTVAQATSLLHLFHDHPPTASGPSLASSATVAVLALPQPDGGCLDLRIGPTSPAPTGSAPLSLSAWPAPADAPCTGAFALPTAAYVTLDPHAGG